MDPTHTLGRDEAALQRCCSTQPFFPAAYAPGASLPAHDHPADEECLVLEGEVMLGDILGRAGDYHLAPKGLPHGTITSKTGALLFIRAGITEHAA